MTDSLPHIKQILSATSHILGIPSPVSENTKAVPESPKLVQLEDLEEENSVSCLHHCSRRVSALVRERNNLIEEIGDTPSNRVVEIDQDIRRVILTMEEIADRVIAADPSVIPTVGNLLDRCKHIDRRRPVKAPTFLHQSMRDSKITLGEGSKAMLDAQDEQITELLTTLEHRLGQIKSGVTAINEEIHTQQDVTRDLADQLAVNKHEMKSIEVMFTSVLENHHMRFIAFVVLIVMGVVMCLAMMTVIGVQQL